MNDINVFEYAAVNKIRFPFHGSIATEDLYDLSVTDLDSIYKTLNREIKKADEESLLNTKSKADITLNVKIEIVKTIVSQKLAQAEARKVAQEKKQRNERIKELIAQKQDESLQNKSIEELQQLLDE